MEKSIEKKKTKTAHSNFRHGMSDYNDGGLQTHYLGNDEYKEGNKESDSLGEGLFDGSVAEGNDLLEDDFDYYEDETDSYEESDSQR
jgi:hypothetical protein